MLRTILPTLCLLLAMTVQAANEKTLPANDSGVTYTGRIGYLAIEVSEAGESWHNLFIDGQWERKLHITGTTPQRIVLAERLGKGTHRLRLQIRTLQTPFAHVITSL